jgi:hypothetical protein
MAFLASLGSAAVHRLKHTKAKLHPKLIAKWEALAALMSHDGSYRSYRAALSMARRMQLPTEHRTIVAALL